MSDDLVKVTVSEGKYTFGQRKDGSCYALRYGETWREDIFDGLTLAMAHRIEELEAKLKTAEEIGRAFEEDAGQLRVKLAKAVELAFEECPFLWGTLSCYNWLWRNHCATRAALKGDKP
jgi:hypothetical protein